MKIPSWGLHAGGMLIAIVAGVLIGKGMGSGSGGGAATGADGNPPPRSRDRSQLAGGNSEARPSRDGRPGASVERGDRASTGTDLQAILGTTNRLQRTQQFLNLLERLPDGEFANVYEQLKEGPGAALRNSERSMLLQAWAQRDPYAATEHLQVNGAADWERETVLGSWAAADPEGAFCWAINAEDAGETNNWVVGAIQGTAAADPILARELLGRLEAGPTRREALGDVQKYVTQFGYDYAEDWITKIEDQGLQLEVSRRLADDLANLDPVRAGSWNEAISDLNTRRNVSETVADRWARQDLDAAREWVESLPQDTMTEAAEGVARQYARTDLEAGAAWLAGLGDDPDLDGARRRFIDEAFTRDPAVSLSVVSNLADKRNREKSYYRYLGSWMKQDPQQARSWASENAGALPEKLANRVLR